MAYSQSYGKLSGTALEGIRMLKHGCTAHKYGRSGRPHTVAFKLSQDERTLSWQGKRKSLGGRLPLPGTDERSVALSAVSQLLVGRESAVFRRQSGDGRRRSSSLPKFGGGGGGGVDDDDDDYADGDDDGGDDDDGHLGNPEVASVDAPKARARARASPRHSRLSA